MKFTFAILAIVMFLPSLIAQTKLQKPIGVYVTWGAHDQLSDNIPITRAMLDMQLEHYFTLRNYGATLNYFLIDMYWFDPHTGAYSDFNKTNFAVGIDDFFEKCKRNNVDIGLWISPNVLGWSTDIQWITYQNRWADAAAANKLQMAMYTGSYLQEVLKNMQTWYNKGVRLFKIDFAATWVAKAGDENKYTPTQIRKMNEEALYNALLTFKKSNPDVVLVAYNGFDNGNKPGWPEWVGEKEIKSSLNTKWLDVFEAMFCGDPALGRVPTSNFWRSIDIYADQMLREMHFNKIPLSRIDHSSFFMANTGTGYWRGKTAWKSMAIMSLSRSSFFQTYYGDLSLLTDADKQWFAKVQSLFFDALQSGSSSVFGGFPSENQPYGYLIKTSQGELLTLVNPAQAFKKASLPIPSPKYRILFKDKGYIPVIEEGQITLGPEQMVVVGFNAFSEERFDMGTEEEVVIPKYINQLSCNFTKTMKNTFVTEVSTTPKADVRIVIEFVDSLGKAQLLKTNISTPYDEAVKISAKSLSKNIPVQIKYNKKIWSGLYWVCAEIKNADIAGIGSFKIECKILQNNKYYIKTAMYEIKY